MRPLLPSLLLAAALLLASPAGTGPARGASSAPGVRASAEAAVSAAQPRRRDMAGAPLRVGGEGRWHTLLRFRAGGRGAVGRATLRVYVSSAPARGLSVRRLTGGLSWREGRVTFARTVRRGSAPAGAWAPRSCKRRCAGGRWLSIDVSRAVRRRGSVSLVLSAAGREPLIVAGRRDARHAPRLVLEAARPNDAPGSHGGGAGPGAGMAPGAGGGVLLAAAGDIACRPAADDPCAQQATSDLVLASGAAAVLALGDMAYDSGTLEQYRTLFEPSWGRVRALLRPVPGNHDYQTSGAAGYFDYFNGEGVATGRAGERGKGWYSFDLGAWHVVALNSNCGDVGCAAGSEQEAWLRADLAASRARCTLAFWHHPRFSTGEHGDADAVAPLWQALYDAGAELVLSGHDHDYERFTPLTASGVPDPARGLRQLVAGTGGRHLRPFVGATRATSEARDATTFGVLFLTLRPAGYDWRFAPAVGTFTDAGTSGCHE